METAENILSQLDKIQGWSVAALVLGCCIAVGYMLRVIKSFPNEAIPVVVILTGALSMLLLADPRPTAMSARIWTTRNFIVGLILGLTAWMGHKIIVSKIEDFLIKKSDAVARLLGMKTGNTEVVKKEDTTKSS